MSNKIKLNTGKRDDTGKNIIVNGEFNPEIVKYMVDIFNRKITIEKQWTKFRAGSIGHAIFAAMIKFNKISVFDISKFYTDIQHDAGNNRNNIMVWGSNARTAGIPCTSKYGGFTVKPMLKH